MIIKKRPWWKFWPVVCRRHWRPVPRNDTCPRCSEEAAAARAEGLVFKRMADDLRSRGVR